jgi:hypothetical protein
MVTKGISAYRFHRPAIFHTFAERLTVRPKIYDSLIKFCRRESCREAYIPSHRLPSLANPNHDDGLTG